MKAKPNQHRTIAVAGMPNPVSIPPNAIHEHTGITHERSLPVEGAARAEEEARRHAQGRRLPATRHAMETRDGAPDAHRRAPRPLRRQLSLRRPRGILGLGRRCLLPRPLPRRQGRRGRDEVRVDAPRPRALPQLHLPRLVLSRWPEEGDGFAHAAVGGAACWRGVRGFISAGEQKGFQISKWANGWKP